MAQFFVHGMFTGVYYYCFKLPYTDQPGPFSSYVFKVKDLIDSATAASSSDSIVSLVYFPFDYSGEEDQSVSSEVLPVAKTDPVSFTYTYARPRRIGSYVPRNKKLLAFPYNFFTISTLDQTKELRYEWFTYADEENPTFTLKTFSSLSANPEIACVPLDYKTVSGANWQEEIVLTNFPQLAFTIDTYRAWVAQHAVQTGASLAGSLITTAATGGLTAPAAIAGGLGMAGNVAGMVRDMNKADAVRGSLGGSVETANGAKTFYFMNSHITEEYAKMIDDYFDRFGYACCRVQTPNLHARTRYTYVQTRNAAVSGNIPAEDQRQIEGILNKGVTFWADTANVGNYTLGNEVIS